MNAAERQKQRADALGIAYKGKGRNTKEAFKKRCLEELKRRRRARFDANRQDLMQVVQDVMGSELRTIQQEQRSTRSGMDASDDDVSHGHPSRMDKGADGDEETAPKGHWPDDAGSHHAQFTSEEQEQLIELWDTIEEELVMEESKILVEMDDEQAALAERELEYDEQSVISAVEHNEHVAITCPVCLSWPLHQHMCVIWCRCGLRLNTQADSMTLDDFGRLLQSMVERHSESGCGAQLQFKKEASPENPTFCILTGYCTACNAFEVL